jgi:mevalonate kinase
MIWWPLLNRRERHVQEFDKTQDVKILQQIQSHPLDLVQLAIVETFAHYRKQPNHAFDIHIDSKIPLGGRLGSSAAVAVSVVAAVTKTLASITFDVPTIHQIAHTVENYQHGNSSGVDPATVAYGGLRWYRRECPVFKVISEVGLPISKEMNQKFILVDTGKPHETTGELVTHVRNLSEQRRNVFNQNQEQITRDMLVALSNNDSQHLTQLIRDGEANLESVGVVSESAKQFIREIEKTGGAGKINGGGGQNQGSGFLLVFHPDLPQVKKIAKQHGFAAIETSLGGKGVEVITNE